MSDIEKQISVQFPATLDLANAQDFIDAQSEYVSPASFAQHMNVGMRPVAPKATA